MADALHSLLAGADVHPAHAFTFADRTARLAAVPSAADVGKVALQQSDQTLWALVGAAPAVWRLLTPFGPGVEAVTYLIRPRGNVGDPPSMTAFIVHGPHVTNFTRPDSGTYLITLDRAYEADEVAVVVLGMGALDDLITYPYGIWASAGNPPVGGQSNGLVNVPTAWQTGPLGEKNMRVVTAAALDLGNNATVPPNQVTFLGKHSDPLTIMLVFLDRTKSQFRSTPI